MSVDISIIVCHHRGELLFGFLDSLNKSEGDVKFETIILTSNDDLAVKGINGCMVFNHYGLPAEKRNAGARIAKGKFLAFFDDDVTIDPLCLYHLKDGIKDDVAMTYGRLWNMEHRNRFDEAGSFLTKTGFLWSRAGQNDIDTGQYSKDEYILSGKSASCMIRTDVFKKIGGFDEDFGILGEETDLAWRVWLYGYKVLYTPQATGLHAFNTKFKDPKVYYTSERVNYNGPKNYITMLIKNLEWRNLWMKLIVQFTIWFIAGLVMVGTLRVKQGMNIWKGLFYIPKNLRYLINKRRKVQDKRVIFDKELLPIIQRRTPRGYYSQRFYRYVKGGLHG